MRFVSLLFSALLFLGIFVPASHGQAIYTPPTGSDERKAIMDALRPACEADLHQHVIFKVELLKVSGQWAAARVTPLQPNGSPINYLKTKYREDVENGAFDSGGEALLQFHKGAWHLLKWRFGATDTELPEWIEKYGAPTGLGSYD